MHGLKQALDELEPPQPAAADMMKRRWELLAQSHGFWSALEGLAVSSMDAVVAGLTAHQVELEVAEEEMEQAVQPSSTTATTTTTTHEGNLVKWTIALLELCLERKFLLSASMQRMAAHFHGNIYYTPLSSLTGFSRSNHVPIGVASPPRRRFSPV